MMTFTIAAPEETHGASVGGDRPDMLRSVERVGSAV